MSFSHPTKTRAACAGLWLALLAVVLGCGGVADEKPKPRPVVDADFQELVRDWRRNPIATHEKYSGKAVRVTGYLYDVGARGGGEYYVEIAGEADAGWLQAKIKASVPARPLVREIGKFDKKSKITVEIILQEGAGSSPEATLQAIQKPTEP